MIEQSLCHHLQSQLTEYYRLIAVLESQMSMSVRSDGSPLQSATEAGNVREEESGLTLKRLDVWIEDWRLRMRMMSVCVEGARGEFLSNKLARYDRWHFLRCTRWGSGESHTRIRGQWRSFRAKIHRSASRRGMAADTLGLVSQMTYRSRSPHHSSPRCTNGCSLVNSMTRFRNSSSLWIRSLRTCSTCNHLRALQAASFLATEALVDWALMGTTSPENARVV